MERFIKPDTYAVWSKDCQVRYNSTSGGAFSEFAKIILSQGGLLWCTLSGSRIVFFSWKGI